MFGLNFLKSTRKNKALGFSQKVRAFEEKPRLQYLLPWRDISPHTGIVVGKNNDFMAVFRFRGEDLDSSTNAEMVMYNASLNNVMRQMAQTGYVMYLEAQRHIASNYVKSDMPISLLQKMEDERAAYYDGQNHYESSYYAVIYYEPPQVIKSKITAAFIEDKKHNSQDSASDLKVFNDELAKFQEKCKLVEALLSHVFSDFERLDAKEVLSYLHSTISCRKFTPRYNPLRYVSDYIADESVLGGREPMLGDHHMRIVTIMDFPPMSCPGIFDVLNRLGIEYRWVSRFVFMSKTDAKNELKKHQQLWGQQTRTPFDIAREAILQEHQMIDPDAEAAINKEDAIAALGELSQDAVVYGYYTMTVILLDKDAEKANEKANKILEAINSLGFAGYIEKDNSMEAWFGSIPGCYRANIRRPIVSSLNFCHCAPVTTCWPGDKNNAHLKGPVLLYTDTDGSTPFRLSLHVGEVGHTMITGPSGAGKSVLLNTLEAHFLKYKDSKIFIFDKAASSRALTLAVGGNFYNLTAEGASELSFQPLAHIDDDSEIKWAKEWLLTYLRQRNLTLTPEHDDYIWRALQSLALFPKNQRTISNFCDMVQNSDIRMTLRPLTVNGSYGKLFDNSADVCGSSRWQVFEMETLMATPAIVPATLDYLFHRIESSLKEASGPAIIVLDECWLFLIIPLSKTSCGNILKICAKKIHPSSLLRRISLMLPISRIS